MMPPVSGTSVPAEAVQDVVLDCAAKGVHGLVVVSSGSNGQCPDRLRLQARINELKNKMNKRS